MNGDRARTGDIVRFRFREDSSARKVLYRVRVINPPYAAILDAVDGSGFVRASVDELVVHEAHPGGARA